ncbi:hypothetical protein [Marinilabilia rubra]|uniref:hypothetical protein n=1 Tax=Marinilabilia rubra TaxID=2162893 RepID=UPI001E54AA53|nr:hypothetical protein [Marinilabilia rubra]
MSRANSSIFQSNKSVFSQSLSFKVFILIIISMLFGQMKAQEKFFTSTGEAAFLEKIEDIFKASSERKKAKDYLDGFEEFWLSPSTPDEAKTAIIEISDLLYDKNARAFPDYHLFLTTVQSFVQNDQLNKNFSIWVKATKSFFEKQKFAVRHFNKILDTTQGILIEQRIFSSPGVAWFSRTPEYQFIFENDSLKLSLPSTTLVCHSRNDSISIYNTRGKMDVVSGLWEGIEGRVTWERSGYASNKVYADFDAYTVDMDDSDFVVKNVTFYNRFYFNSPLKGNLTHKVMSINSPSSSTYPKFESYEQVFRIDNIHPNMNYKGGFSQHGAKFLGSGTDKNPATISIFRNDTLFISAKSLFFALREDEILSKNTEVTMHLDTGTIHHPGLEFKYMAPSNDLYLIRSGEGISQSPFFDTYHNVSIDSEIIHWNLNNHYMELRMLDGASRNHSFFESLSFYRESFFNYLQGMDAIHPLFGLRNCYYQNKKKPFTAKDYARFLNRPESQVRQQILKLSFSGFVDFNVNTDTVKIQERLMDYIKFRMGKKDYDVIRFKSTTPENEPNAIFDLKNYDLALNGVENISISDHQNVVFLPENKEVTLKNNRNFSFNGHILAGMIELFGDGFFFSYDDFRIDMQTIDSMRMSVESDRTDNYGRPLLRTIDNTVAGLSGYLQIDTANNKSGILDFPRFPVLVSDRNSFVYYDRGDIQDGAYDSENFYFELNPFEIDSINNLNLSNIVFDGKLVSNIFPEIEDQLVVRNDYSLGFIKTTPSDGYPIYKERARFTNEIDLSNEGLKGNGRLDYLTSSAESEEFTFLPDETKGEAHTFNIEPQTTGVEYPDVQGENVQINYFPNQEELLAQTTSQEMHIFKEETSLKGGLTLAPNGLVAHGKLFMPSANLVSKKMDLTHHGLMTDSADFNLIGDEEMEGVSFKTNNLIADLDFEERQGRFQSRDMGNKVEFTENRYIAYISEFSWDMDMNDIYMGASGSEGNRFVSTHRKQDSLDFRAPLAVYDIETRTIEASEVYNIQVADADIILNDGIVKIHQDAKMDPLDSTFVVLKDSKHKFKNAHIAIEGKHMYNGYGEYDFINGDDKEFTLDFHNISVNDEVQTEAEGTIPEDKLFTFDEHFAFQGDVALKTGEPLLTFDGGTQLLHRCSQKGPQDYVRFTSKIDPDSIRIPIDEKTVNMELEDLSHDVFLNLDSTHIYSAFLEKNRRINNTPIVRADGFLRYNKGISSFEIAEPRKLAQPDSSGNIIRYLEKECAVTGEGELNLGIDLEQVKLHASGKISHLKAENEIDINALLGADFMLDPASLTSMANIIRASKAPDANDKKEITEKRLREWTTSKTAKKVADLIQPTTDIIEVLPPELQYTLGFTNIDFRWDTPSRSYVADGKANLGWIHNLSVAREVDVKALISRSRGGNSFEIHIQADPDTWFFYSYNNGKMLILSSSDSFNEAIQRLDIDERKIKTGLGQDNYVFQIGSNNRLRSFMDFFKAPENENIENKKATKETQNENDTEKEEN